MDKSTEMDDLDKVRESTEFLNGAMPTESIPQPAELPKPATANDGEHGIGRTFVMWTIVNTLATIGIVFTNKRIFSDPNFKNMQTSFAAFHFLCTTLTLYLLSRPPFSLFTPRTPASYLAILPLALAMCCNVLLPNLSLAHSSITFYQIARILLTPTVALINRLFYHTSISRAAALSLIPVCCGVALVSYYDTQTKPPPPGATPPKIDKNSITTPLGVTFAFAGVLASSLYTVWIGSYHKRLGMTSMQLLYNQAPLASLFLSLGCAWWADTFPAEGFGSVPTYRWVSIGMSGGFASLINMSQFFIIASAGPVSSTVVGHLKTCSIVMLGWVTSGRTVGDRSLVGIALALGGMILYSYVVANKR